MSKPTKHNTALEAQRQRLLAALQKAGGTGITTLQARHELNVMHPGGRIHELRNDYGLNIQTIWTTDTTPEGFPHRTARYVLLPGKFKGVA